MTELAEIKRFYSVVATSRATTAIIERGIVGIYGDFAAASRVADDLQLMLAGRYDFCVSEFDWEVSVTPCRSSSWT